MAESYGIKNAIAIITGIGAFFGIISFIWQVCDKYFKLPVINFGCLIKGQKEDEYLLRVTVINSTNTPMIMKENASLLSCFWWWDGFDVSKPLEKRTFRIVLDPLVISPYSSSIADIKINCKLGAIFFFPFNIKIKIAWYGKCRNSKKRLMFFNENYRKLKFFYSLRLKVLLFFCSITRSHKYKLIIFLNRLIKIWISNLLVQHIETKD